MITTTNRPWILRWPALTLLAGIATAGTYQVLSAFEIAGIGAEGDIGGGGIWLLGLLLIVTGATSAVAARPRPPVEGPAAEDIAQRERRRWIPAAWPARLLTVGLTLSGASMVVMVLDLDGWSWIGAIAWAVGMIVSIVGAAATFAYHQSSSRLT
jgi:hypothetical protein